MKLTLFLFEVLYFPIYFDKFCYSLDMKDSSDVSLISRKLSSSLSRICINEISICNHPYIISMCINNSEEAHIEIKIEEKENGDHWKSSFDVIGKYIFFSRINLFISFKIAIETMTAKTGSFKSFNGFVNMLENAIKQVRLTNFGRFYINLFIKIRKVHQLVLIY